jgi:hypothetical protein
MFMFSIVAPIATTSACVGFSFEAVSGKKI